MTNYLKGIKSDFNELIKYCDLLEKDANRQYTQKMKYYDIIEEAINYINNNAIERIASDENSYLELSNCNKLLEILERYKRC